MAFPFLRGSAKCPMYTGSAVKIQIYSLHIFWRNETERIQSKVIRTGRNKWNYSWISFCFVLPKYVQCEPAFKKGRETGTDCVIGIRIEWGKNGRDDSSRLFITLLPWISNIISWRKTSHNCSGRNRTIGERRAFNFQTHISLALKEREDLWLVF